MDLNRSYLRGLNVDQLMLLKRILMAGSCEHEKNKHILKGSDDGV
jgi:hypothetical protein